MNILEHVEDIQAQVQDALFGKLSLDALTVVFKVASVPWHNNERHHFKIVDIVGIFAFGLNYDSEFNDLWCRTLQLKFTVLVDALHNVDFLSEHLVLLSELDDQWSFLILKIYDFINLSERTLINLPCYKISFLQD